MNGARYVDILESQLLPLLEEYMVKEVTFRNYYAPLRTL